MTKLSEPGEAGCGTGSKFKHDVIATARGDKMGITGKCHLIIHARQVDERVRRNTDREMLNM